LVFAGDGVKGGIAYEAVTQITYLLLVIVLNIRELRETCAPFNMSDPVSQYQEAVAKAESLKPKAIQFLHDRKAAIQKEVAELDREIASMTGQMAQTAKPRTQKPAGKQISFRLLADLLKDRPDKTMNIRKEGYDTAWMKQLVKDNPGKLTLGGVKPWPTVTLLNGK
jgi:hypothetical protein